MFQENTTRADMGLKSQSMLLEDLRRLAPPEWTIVDYGKWLDEHPNPLPKIMRAAAEKRVGDILVSYPSQEKDSLMVLECVRGSQSDMTFYIDGLKLKSFSGWYALSMHGFSDGPLVFFVSSEKMRHFFWPKGRPAKSGNRITVAEVESLNPIYGVQQLVAAKTHRDA